MYIFFQHNQYLSSYYLTRSADDPVTVHFACPSGLSENQLNKMKEELEKIKTTMEELSDALKEVKQNANDSSNRFRHNTGCTKFKDDVLMGK